MRRPRIRECSVALRSASQSSFDNEVGERIHDPVALFRRQAPGIVFHHRRAGPSVPAIGGRRRAGRSRDSLCTSSRTAGRIHPRSAFRALSCASWNGVRKRARSFSSRSNLIAKAIALFLRRDLRCKSMPGETLGCARSQCHSGLYQSARASTCTLHTLHSSCSAKY